MFEQTLVLSFKTWQIKYLLIFRSVSIEFVPNSNDRSIGYLPTTVVKHLLVLHITYARKKCRHRTAKEVHGTDHRVDGWSEATEQRGEWVHEGGERHLLENLRQIELHKYHLCVDSPAEGNLLRFRFAQIHRLTHEMHLAKCEEFAGKIKRIGLRCGSARSAWIHGAITIVVLASTTHRHTTSNGQNDHPSFGPNQRQQHSPAPHKNSYTFWTLFVFVKSIKGKTK